MPATNKASSVLETDPAAMTLAATATLSNKTSAVVNPAETALAQAQPETMYDALPVQLQKVGTAMEGLCNVLYGDQFNREQIWSTDTTVAAKDITKYLGELPLQSQIKDTLAQVKARIEKVDPLRDAVNKMLDGMHSVVVKIEEGASAVKDATDLVKPVSDLSLKLLPHVVDAVKAATTKDIGAEVNGFLDFIRGAEAVVRLGLFATGLVVALETYLQPAKKP